jgi:thymidine kinase
MSLEIVLGPMFSGKSTYALSYIRRQKAIGKQVLVIKPNIDNRYSQDDVLVTHNHEQSPCMVWDVNEILNPTMSDVRNADCVVLEESQFFKGLADFVMYAMEAYRKNIIVVGLDGDSSQRPFGDILRCIPLATRVTKLCALCRHCRDGTLAPFTRKLCQNTNDQVDIGGSEKYESVCLKHLNEPI